MGIDDSLAVIEDLYDDLVAMSDEDYSTNNVWTDITTIGGAYLTTALELYGFSDIPTRQQAIIILKHVYVSILPIVWANNYIAP